MKTGEQDDAATPRAGGNVIWKSASQAPPAGSSDEPANTSSEVAESETRAGGDVLSKGASQTQSGESQ